MIVIVCLQKVFLPAMYSGGHKIQNHAKFKMDYCSITDENKKYIRNFIPCYCTTVVTDAKGKKCSANTNGLYDTAEGKFYTNQGSGAFLRGEDV